MLKLTQLFSRRHAKGPENGPVIIHRKRIFIMPNKPGLIFTIVVFTMLFGSINYDNNLGYALSFLLIGLGLISILHTHSNLAQLIIEAGGSAPAFAGDTVSFFINLSSRVNEKYNIKIDNDYSSDSIDLSGHDKSQIQLKLPSNRRGYLPVGKFRISTDYPFGIIQAWTWVELDLKALIYPAPETEIHAVKMTSSNKTAIASNDLNQNDDFAGFRNYQPGDSPKQLYWKYYSANETLLTKLFAGGGEDEIWLAWDTVAHLPIEQALSRLCQWIIRCEKTSRKYGLSLPASTIKPARGVKHKYDCLRQLALF